MSNTVGQYIMQRVQESGVWQSTVIDNVREWWKVVEARAHTDGNNGLLNADRVFWEPSPRLPDNCIISADSGTTASWSARDLKIRPGLMSSNLVPH
jgi:pyruvate dehydrogenase (quinone)